MGLYLAFIVLHVQRHWNIITTSVCIITECILYIGAISAKIVRNLQQQRIWRRIIITMIMKQVNLRKCIIYNHSLWRLSTRINCKSQFKRTHWPKALQNKCNLKAHNWQEHALNASFANNAQLQQECEESYKTKTYKISAFKVWNMWEKCKKRTWFMRPLYLEHVTYFDSNCERCAKKSNICTTSASIMKIPMQIMCIYLWKQEQIKGTRGMEAYVFKFSSNIN